MAGKCCQRAMKEAPPAAHNAPAYFSVSAILVSVAVVDDLSFSTSAWSTAIAPATPSCFAPANWRELISPCWRAILTFTLSNLSTTADIWVLRIDSEERTSSLNSRVNSRVTGGWRGRETALLCARSSELWGSVGLEGEGFGVFLAARKVHCTSTNWRCPADASTLWPPLSAEFLRLKNLSSRHLFFKGVPSPHCFLVTIGSRKV